MMIPWWSLQPTLSSIRGHGSQAAGVQSWLCHSPVMGPKGSTL